MAPYRACRFSRTSQLLRDVIEGLSSNSEPSHIMATMKVDILVVGVVEDRPQMGLAGVIIYV